MPEPDALFKLVVNVSAPEGSGLDYEGESYRITRSLSESCELAPTELGTVEDLLETAAQVQPTRRFEESIVLWGAWKAMFSAPSPGRASLRARR